MSGFQPHPENHVVYYNGNAVNDITCRAMMRGVYIKRIHGWDDGVEVRDVRENRSGDDGEHTDTAYMGGRTITIEGEVYGEDWEDLQDYKRALSAIFYPSADEALLKVPLPSSTSPVLTYASTGMASYERALCRPIDGGVQYGDLVQQFGDVDAGAFETFQVVLRASDPRIYSDTLVSSSGSGTISVGGRVETPATLVAYMASSFSGGEVSRLKMGDSQWGFIMDRLAVSDEVTIYSLDKSADWKTTYHNGRLKLFDPVAFWRLNETAGTTADNCEGTAAYDGTYTAGYTLNQTGHDTSIISVDLNGTTGYVTVPFNANLNPTVFSVEAWAQFDVSSGSGAIAGSFRNNGGAYTGWMLWRTGNVFQLRWWTGTGTTEGNVTAFTATDTSSWYHVVGVFGESGVRLYVNSVMEAAISYTNAGAVFSPVTAASAFTIGRVTDGGGNAFLDGEIDNVALYDQELRASQVADLYAASAASPTFTGYGHYVIEPSMTRWGHFQVGNNVLSDDGDVNNVGYSYREARL